MTTTKPYLLRAIFEWAEDNNLTPQVLVNAQAEGVEVPQEHVVDGQIVLNISSSAVKLHIMDNECLSFSARFSGVERDLYAPMDAIVAIFARENSQGIFFEDMGHDLDPDPNPTKEAQAAPKKSQPTAINSKKNKTKKPSHLKIIK